jgi:hypothetical protein
MKQSVLAERHAKKFFRKGDQNMYRFWLNAFAAFKRREHDNDPLLTDCHRITQALSGRRVEKIKTYNRFYLFKLAFLKLLNYY